MTTTPDFCTDLLFDASFFDAPVWRLDNTDRAADAADLARSAGVALIVARPGKTDRSVRDAGFRMIETLLTLEAPLPVNKAPSEPIDVRVRVAQGEADAEGCSRIARVTFRTDRFHADPAIPDAVADRLKAEWARNDAMGRADTVFVVEDGNDGIVGFNAVVVRSGVPVIDLIAVAPGSQGAGLGRLLVLSAMEHYRKSACMRVGTQVTNDASLSLYNSLGFSEVTRTTTWHWTPG